MEMQQPAVRRYLFVGIVLLVLDGVTSYILISGSFIVSPIVVMVSLLGVICNLLVVVANEGYMPVLVRNEGWAEIVTASAEHKPVTKHTRFLLLADIFSSPAMVDKCLNKVLGKPAGGRRMFSIGDLLLLCYPLGLLMVFVE